MVSKADHASKQASSDSLMQLCFFGAFSGPRHASMHETMSCHVPSVTSEVAWSICRALCCATLRRMRTDTRQLPTAFLSGLLHAHLLPTNKGQLASCKRLRAYMMHARLRSTQFAPCHSEAHFHGWQAYLACPHLKHSPLLAKLDAPQAEQSQSPATQTSM